MSTEVKTIRFIESDTEFIEKTGICINTMEGENIETWLYFPFWLKRVGKNEYVQYSFENLPESVKETIKHIRDGNPKTI